MPIRSWKLTILGAGLASAALLSATDARAACGAAYQRMQVGVLPDLFLNYTAITIVQLKPNKGVGDWFTIEPPAWAHLPIFRGEVALSHTVRSKVIDHSWTANLDFPGIGDCNVIATTTIRHVGLANTYGVGGPCPSTDIMSCPVVMYPAAATVGPAISDFTVKEWPMRVVARNDAVPGTIGAVNLYGLDCQGDICVPPPCLMLPEEQGTEFYDPPPPECIEYEEGGAGWSSTGPGVGDAYLLGRGNLYIGPREQPAFKLTANTTSAAVDIDHWIANDNPQALVFVTPSGAHTGATAYYGVKYDEVRRRWTIVPERDGADIPAGSTFNVYVMGNRGPGMRVHSAEGATTVFVDDPLTNGNPNALLFVSHLVDDACVWNAPSGKTKGIFGPPFDPKAPHGHWDCTSGRFEHPIGVYYDAGRKQWGIVSEDGTPFPSPIAFNVLVSGLPGSYRSALWTVGEEPDYGGSLESGYSAPVGDAMPVPQLAAPTAEDVVLVTHQLTPTSAPHAANLHPAGVEHDGKYWTVRNLDGAAMPPTAFNVIAPLPAP